MRQGGGLRQLKTYHKLVDRKRIQELVSDDCGEARVLWQLIERSVPSDGKAVTGQRSHTAVHCVHVMVDEADSAADVLLLDLCQVWRHFHQMKRSRVFRVRELRQHSADVVGQSASARTQLYHSERLRTAVALPLVQQPYGDQLLMRGNDMLTKEQLILGLKPRRRSAISLAML